MVANPTTISIPTIQTWQKLKLILVWAGLNGPSASFGTWPTILLPTHDPRYVSMTLKFLVYSKSRELSLSVSFLVIQFPLFCCLPFGFCFCFCALSSHFFLVLLSHLLLFILFSALLFSMIILVAPFVITIFGLYPMFYFKFLVETWLCFYILSSTKPTEEDLISYFCRCCKTSAAHP